MRLIFTSAIAAVMLFTSSGCGEEKKGKTGGNASKMSSMGKSKGEEQDGVKCDAQTEGQAFCADEYTIVFCEDKEWWALDCGEFGAYCGYDGDIIDCFYE